ncbi:glycosyltransferase family A protein [Alkalimonas delamerensis]|uniref:Glycosyltransferase family A protein n=1 Tax=Alkalimonas delamerensis TaxID=265981 RepID=A0ABT9GPT6_9GAMM|nr:glycosyltransferase family A protein [Alkalimonas delamerensis]MDP4528979.1 glycosyltransferase family A protein [Alkalimonas delamerensis]
MFRKSVKKVARMFSSRGGRNNITFKNLLVTKGCFDTTWYLKKYPDIAADSYWSANALEHYLKHGGFEGRKPVPWFDSAWYLQRYQDVQDSGMNPFIHFLLHGSQEGRQSSATKLNRNNTEYIRSRIVRHLWGGYSEPALNRLKAIYNDEKKEPELRFFAAWHAARWYYFVGSFDTGLELASLIKSLGEPYASKKITMMIDVFCNLNLGRSEIAKKTLDSFLQISPKDSDALFALANTCRLIDEKLEYVNQVYENHQMSRVALRDKSKPLSFDNLVSEAKPVESPFKVSVIIPVYNAGHRIEVAIRSLLNQSWENIEVIVVDDLSPDDTFERALAMSQLDSRVIAIQQPVNGGAYRARNAGLKIATGDFITTHDGDDWSHPQKIEKQLEFLNHNPKVKGVCTYWIRALDDLTFTQNWRLNPELIHWSHSSFLFRREVLDDLGPWDPVMVGGDTEFIWRVQARYGNWAVKNIHNTVPMAFALDDEGSLTRTKSTHVKTIHYGLRHIYRECAQWWHQQQRKTKGLIRLEQEQRTFPAPYPMLSRQKKVLHLDILFVSDFSLRQMSAEVNNQAREALDAGLRVGLFHWPKFAAEVTALKHEYFELLAHLGAEPVVYGQKVECAKVVAASPKLLQHLLDLYPEVSGVREGVLLSCNHKTIEPKIQSRATDNFTKVFGVLPLCKV